MMQEDQHRQWQRELQSAFLCGSLPLSDDMPTYDAIFTQIEAIQANSEWLTQTKIHVVMDAISEISNIPRDGDFNLQSRATALVNKYEDLPNSPIPISFEAKACEAAAPGKELEERAAAQASEENPTPVVMVPIVPSRSTVPPPLPMETLTAIFKSTMMECHEPSSNWDFHDSKDWREGINLLLSGALVARDWYISARRLLYAGRINLNKSESVRLLLRTVQEDLGTPCPIRHLFLEDHVPPAGEEFRVFAAKLIVRCTKLQYLEGSLGALSFSKSTPIPVFESLRELRVTNQVFHRLAPLLHCLPNLESLDVLYIADPLVESPMSVLMGTLLDDNLGVVLKDIPSPKFSLKTLRLSQSDLARSQWRWLFSSCTSIEYAELQELYENAAPLANVIGTSVRSLHLKGALDTPQEGDDELVETLPAYTNLTSLRISGRDWPWTELLSNIKASLESFAISYSGPGVDSVAQALSNPGWQPSLQVVTIHHWADTDYFYEVKASDVKGAREKLEHLCARRSVKLHWITEGDPDLASVGYGIRESD